MALELLTLLPPGAPSHTRLARHGQRLVVLRELKDGTDCSWPAASPGLVTVQEVGELQGKRHALFEWVPGVTLRELIAALDAGQHPVPLGVVLRVVVDACRALAPVAPKAHGGVSDASLQVGFDGAVWVLDWGAARVSRFRALGRASVAGDVFAMGAVVHAALTGFVGDYATLAATLPPPSRSHPEATAALDAVVARALGPVAQRFDSLAALAEALELAWPAGARLEQDAVAALVQSMFRERIKQLQSLGGLVPEVDASGELPLAGVPLATEPGLPARAIVLEGGAGFDDDEPTATDVTPMLRPTPVALHPSPRAMPERRGTTEHERMRARGQERIATPPPELLAVLNQPTAVTAIPTEARAAQPAPTPAFDDLPRRRPVSGLRIAIGVLLAVVLALGVAVFLRRSAPPMAEPDPVPPPPAPVVDAGSEATPDAGEERIDSAGEVLEASADAGVAVVEDAGVPAQVDAGAPGTLAKPPVKRKIAATKKRRRR